MKYLNNFFKQGLDFKGTTGRSDYWYTQLALLVFFMVVGFVAAFMYGFFGVFISQEALDVSSAILVIALGLVFIVCNLSLTVRRIRDLGVSGWFYLVWLLIGVVPYIGFVFQIIALCLKTDALKSNNA